MGNTIEAPSSYCDSPPPYSCKSPASRGRISRRGRTPGALDTYDSEDSDLVESVELDTLSAKGRSVVSPAYSRGLNDQKGGATDGQTKHSVGAKVPPERTVSSTVPNRGSRTQVETISSSASRTSSSSSSHSGSSEEGQISDDIMAKQHVQRPAQVPSIKGLASGGLISSLSGVSGGGSFRDRARTEAAAIKVVSRRVHCGASAVTTLSRSSTRDRTTKSLPKVTGAMSARQSTVLSQSKTDSSLIVTPRETGAGTERALSSRRRSADYFSASYPRSPRSLSGRPFFTMDGKTLTSRVSPVVVCSRRTPLTSTAEVSPLLNTERHSMVPVGNGVSCSVSKVERISPKNRQASQHDDGALKRQLRLRGIRGVPEDDASPSQDSSRDEAQRDVVELRNEAHNRISKRRSASVPENAVEEWDSSAMLDAEHSKKTPRDKSAGASRPYRVSSIHEPSSRGPILNSSTSSSSSNSVSCTDLVYNSSMASVPTSSSQQGPSTLRSGSATVHSETASSAPFATCCSTVVFTIDPTDTTAIPEDAVGFPKVSERPVNMRFDSRLQGNQSAVLNPNLAPSGLTVQYQATQQQYRELKDSWMEGRGISRRQMYFLCLVFYLLGGAIQQVVLSHHGIYLKRASILADGRISFQSLTSQVVQSERVLPRLDGQESALLPMSTFLPRALASSQANSAPNASAQSQVAGSVPASGAFGVMATTNMGFLFSSIGTFISYIIFRALQRCWFSTEGSHGRATPHPAAQSALVPMGAAESSTGLPSSRDWRIKIKDQRSTPWEVVGGAIFAGCMLLISQTFWLLSDSPTTAAVYVSTSTILSFLLLGVLKLSNRGSGAAESPVLIDRLTIGGRSDNYIPGLPSLIIQGILVTISGIASSCLLVSLSTGTTFTTPPADLRLATSAPSLLQSTHLQSEVIASSYLNSTSFILAGWPIGPLGAPFLVSADARHSQTVFGSKQASSSAHFVAAVLSRGQRSSSVENFHNFDVGSLAMYNEHDKVCISDLALSFSYALFIALTAWCINSLSVLHSKEEVGNAITSGRERSSEETGGLSRADNTNIRINGGDFPGAEVRPASGPEQHSSIGEGLSWSLQEPLLVVTDGEGLGAGTRTSPRARYPGAAFYARGMSVLAGSNCVGVILAGVCGAAISQVAGWALMTSGVVCCGRGLSGLQGTDGSGCLEGSSAGLCFTILMFCNIAHAILNQIIVFYLLAGVSPLSIVTLQLMAVPLSLGVAWGDKRTNFMMSQVEESAMAVLLVATSALLILQIPAKWSRGI